MKRFNLSFQEAYGCLLAGLIVAHAGAARKYRLSKGLCDTDTLAYNRATKSETLTGFRLDLFDHGERGCRTQFPQIMESPMGAEQWTRSDNFPTRTLLSHDWCLLER